MLDGLAYQRFYKKVLQEILKIKRLNMAGHLINGYFGGWEVAGGECFFLLAGYFIPYL